MSSFRSIIDIFSQRSANCWTCASDRPLEVSMREIQLLARACWTEEFLLREMAKLLGAKSRGHKPFNHGELQDLAVRPFPTVTVVAAAKKIWSSPVHGDPMPIQGLLLSTHSNHSHQSQRALANLFKLSTPKPPNCLGLQTRSQLILHDPPETLSVPSQR